MKIPSRLHRANIKLIISSNALTSSLVIDLTKYRKRGYIKEVEKNKATYQLPKQVNR